VRRAGGYGLVGPAGGAGRVRPMQSGAGCVFKFPGELADESAMRHFSVRGFGIRFALALVLPITGIGLVLWTVTQLIVYQLNHA